MGVGRWVRRGGMEGVRVRRLVVEGIGGDGVEKCDVMRGWCGSTAGVMGQG